MLTPQFSVTQTDTDVTLRIRAPHVRATNVETLVAGPNFRFHCKPYFLSVYFNGDLDDEAETEDRIQAKYDIDAGWFTITIPKKVPGTTFEDLDVLPQLLVPPGKREKQERAKAGVGIHEVAADSDDEDGDEEGEEDWTWEQHLPDAAADPTVTDELVGFHYGFANEFRGVLASHQDELPELLDVPDPDTTSPADRTAARIEREDGDFSEDHYMENFVEDDYIQSLLKCEPWWRSLTAPAIDASLAETPSKPTSTTVDASSLATDMDRLTLTPATAPPLEFTQAEQDALVQRSTRKMLVAKADRGPSLLALIDVVLSYALAVRLEAGDEIGDNPEASWMVSTVCATLSGMERFTSLHAVLTAFARRALCYPLYRHRALARRAILDTHTILARGGRRGAIRALLAVHHVLARDDTRFVFNTVWIDPLLNWVIGMGDAKWSSLWRKMMAAVATEGETVGAEVWARVGKEVDGEVASEWRLEQWEALAREIVVEDVDSDDEDE
ncbi:hypothetical protein AMAG_16559 [Allomyces macrogynus ATCC 38327]|uniref:CS domain-containing protein n=1 Tax=Allomyces macrogynus (strain ATCC 38327) TaxID=578462 RepID=A0A0L0TCW2_ALLM3|nr:hypothetical protein AMAG_16559 [Allomyces macrogynus ATCC 38327]|eukprot:KNE72516.1 hypothetical protein AMAG_16559 [Allomyces macrogynus ATCC 38327]